jgi:hypothetical protein
LEAIMRTGSASKSAIGVTAFKAQCLGLIVLLKHNRPVAALVPVNDDAPETFDLWGAMRGTVTVAPGVDLTESTGEVWDAEQ